MRSLVALGLVASAAKVVVGTKVAFNFQTFLEDIEDALDQQMGIIQDVNELYLQFKNFPVNRTFNWEHKDSGFKLDLQVDQVVDISESKREYGVVTDFVYFDLSIHHPKYINWELNVAQSYNPKKQQQKQQQDWIAAITVTTDFSMPWYALDVAIPFSFEDWSGFRDYPDLYVNHNGYEGIDYTGSLEVFVIGGVWAGKDMREMAELAEASPAKRLCRIVYRDSSTSQMNYFKRQELLDYTAKKYEAFDRVIKMSTMPIWMPSKHEGMEFVLDVHNNTKYVRKQDSLVQVVVRKPLQNTVAKGNAQEWMWKLPVVIKSKIQIENEFPQDSYLVIRDHEFYDDYDTPVYDDYSSSERRRREVDLGEGSGLSSFSNDDEDYSNLNDYYASSSGYGSVQDVSAIDDNYSMDVLESERETTTVQPSTTAAPKIFDIPINFQYADGQLNTMGSFESMFVVKDQDPNGPPLECLTRNWINPTALNDTCIWSLNYRGKFNGVKTSDLELKVRKGVVDFSNKSTLMNLLRVLYSVDKQVQHSLFFEKDLSGKTFDLTYKQPDPNDDTRDNVFKIVKAPTEEKLEEIKTTLIQFIVPYIQAGITFYEKPSTLLYLDVVFEKFSDVGMFDLTRIVDQFNFGVAIPLFKVNEHTGDLEFVRFISVTNMNERGRRIVNKYLREFNDFISEFASDFSFYFNHIRGGFQGTANIWKLVEGGASKNDLDDPSESDNNMLMQHDMSELFSLFEGNFKNNTGHEFLQELAYEFREALSRDTRRLVKKVHFSCFDDVDSCMVAWCENVEKYAAGTALSESLAPICQTYMNNDSNDNFDVYQQVDTWNYQNDEPDWSFGSFY